MARLLITDEVWSLVSDVFPERKHMGRPPCDRRQVLNGILWILRTGSPWRDLPEEFGKWQSVWRLFDEWNGDGTLDTILNRLRAAHVDAGELNRELWCIDGTIVRAARCAAGGGKKVTRKNLATTH